VKHQRSDLISPLFVCRNGIQRELQTLIRVFLVAAFPGLVVDDGDAAVRPAVDAIDSADYQRFSNPDFKRLFRMQDLRRRNGSG